jgi:hypothetical protein
MRFEAPLRCLSVVVRTGVFDEKYVLKRGIKTEYVAFCCCFSKSGFSILSGVRETVNAEY